MSDLPDSFDRLIWQILHRREWVDAGEEGNFTLEHVSNSSRNPLVEKRLSEEGVIVVVANALDDVLDVDDIVAQIWAKVVDR